MRIWFPNLPSSGIDELDRSQRALGISRAVNTGSDDNYLRRYLDDPLVISGVGPSLDTLTTPAAPVVTARGITGFCNYSYALVARNARGTTPYSAPGTTIFGSCTALNGSSYNQIDTLNIPGVLSYDVWRTDSESTPDMLHGLVGNVNPGDSFFDIGQIPSLDLSNLPVVNTTGPTVASETGETTYLRRYLSDPV